MRNVRRVVCWLVCVPAVALGQGGQIPDTRPPLDEVVARLDSPVFTAREQASYDLLTREDLTIDEVELKLADPGLSPEQRLRLEWVALEVFRRGPRAALGIRFQPERDGGVRILDTVPDFPASRVLQPDDQIVEADGAPVTRQATFRAAILSHAPKEVMRLTIVREGRRERVDVELGSFESLIGGAGPRETDILEAWNLRRGREGALGYPDPLAPVALAGAPDKPEPGSASWERAYATGDAPSGVRVGGQSRDTVDLSLRQLNAMDASRALTLDDLEGAGQADLVVQISLLRDRRELVLDDLDRINQLIDGRNLDQAGRAMMRRRYDEERRTLQVIEEQIRLLEEARQRRP